MYFNTFTYLHLILTKISQVSAGNYFVQLLSVPLMMNMEWPKPAAEKNVNNSNVFN